MIDDPHSNDNRHYDYSQEPVQQRDEYDIIVDWVEPGSSVVDFGCGNGSLLARLATERQTRGVGFDISESGVKAATLKGLDARVRSIDVHHADLVQGQFDYAICNVTLQMVMYPEQLLREMFRVARRQIISFPNFATFDNCRDLLLRGRMPRPMLFGYQWYNTGHIHQFSIADFEEWIAQLDGPRICSRRSVPALRGWRRWLAGYFPNRFEIIPVYLLETPHH